MQNAINTVNEVLKMLALIKSRKINLVDGIAFIANEYEELEEDGDEIKAYGYFTDRYYEICDFPRGENIRKNYNKDYLRDLDKQLAELLDIIDLEINEHCDNLIKYYDEEETIKKNREFRTRSN